MIKLENGSLIQVNNIIRVYYDESLASWYISFIDGSAERITDNDYDLLCRYITMSASILGLQ